MTPSYCDSQRQYIAASSDLTSQYNCCTLSAFASQQEAALSGDAADEPIFMKPGHNAGGLVEASRWKVLEESRGHVLIEGYLPQHLRNSRQQLFGGFTSVYVDMVSIYTVRTLYAAGDFQWSATVNMRIDYFAPVMGPTLRLRGELINDGNSTCLVATTFTDLAGDKLVYAITTLRKNPPAC